MKGKMFLKPLFFYYYFILLSLLFTFGSTYTKQFTFDLQLFITRQR